MHWERQERRLYTNSTDQEANALEDLTDLSKNNKFVKPINFVSHNTKCDAFWHR
jgi:hypothetical protein